MPRKRKVPPLGEREKLIRDSYPNPRYRILNSIKARFEHGDNPLAPWDAFMFARQVKEPVPEWVLAHFERCAKKLCEVPKGDPLGKIPRHVMKSFGFGARNTGGKGSDFSRYLGEITRWKVVRRFIELREQKPDRSYEQLYMDVAEEFDLPSNRTVEKWVRDLQEIVQKT